MKEQGSGVIVVMGLDQFFIGKCNLFVYGVSKGVLVFMVKIIVFDYVFYNICVNVVCLGIIEILLFYNVIDNYVVCFGVDKNEVVVEEVVVQFIGCLGQFEDVVELIYFLCSNKVLFIMGSLYVVDGGYIV